MNLDEGERVTTVHAVPCVSRDSREAFLRRPRAQAVLAVEVGIMDLKLPPMPESVEVVPDHQVYVGDVGDEARRFDTEQRQPQRRADKPPRPLRLTIVPWPTDERADSHLTLCAAALERRQLTE
jgi:hypothetical protein